MNKIKLLTGIIITVCFVSCTNNSIQSNLNISPYEIKGKALFPKTGLDKINEIRAKENIKKNQLTTKATPLETSTNATISLILPSDDVNANNTITTGLTKDDGSFILSHNTDLNNRTSFVPITNKIYVLEASRRFGTSGNHIMTMRTYIKWNGTKWLSMSFFDPPQNNVSDIIINEYTTALAIYQESKKDIVTSDMTIQKISVNPTSGQNSVVNFTNSDIVNKLSVLVQNILKQSRDPFSLVKMEGSQISVKQDFNISDLQQKNYCNYCSLYSIDLSKVSLKGKDLSYSDLSGMDLSGIDLKDTNLYKADLSYTTFSSGTLLEGTNLTGANFEWSNINGVDLSGAKIGTNNFSNANLSNVNLSNSLIESNNFKNSIINNVNLSNSVMNNNDFSYSEIRSANLSGNTLYNNNFTHSFFVDNTMLNTQFTHSEFPDVRFSNINFSTVSLINSNFSNSDFSNQDFSNVNFTGSNFNACNLTNVKFDNSNLNEVTFSNTNIFGNNSFIDAYLEFTEFSSLVGINFTRGLFFGKNLSNFDLTNTNFSYAYFEGADFTNANITNTNFSNTSLKSTKWVDGTLFSESYFCLSGSLGECISGE